MIQFYTIIVVLFTIILYAYLGITRRELIFRVHHSNKFRFFVIGFSILLLISMLLYLTSVDSLIRNIAAIAIIISFMIENRGLTEDGIAISSLANKPVSYQEIERIVLYQPQQTKVVKLNFFRSGHRGPMLVFSAPIEEIVLFLSTHLNDSAEIEVIIDEK